LFVANRLGHNNFLYHNNGDGTFTKITTGSLVMMAAIRGPALGAIMTTMVFWTWFLGTSTA